MKFRFGDDIKVVKGFYEGAEGYITDAKIFFSDKSYSSKNFYEYFVKGEKIVDGVTLEFSTWIPEQHLSLVK